VVDSYLALNIDKAKNRTLCTTQRYGQDMEPTHILWNDDTQEMSLGSTGEQAAQARAEDTRNRVQCDILRYITNHGPCDIQAVLSAVTGNAQTKKQIFQALKDQTLLAVTGEGVRGDPYLYSVRPHEEQATQILAVM
jgi:hypothetical protein